MKFDTSEHTIQELVSIQIKKLDTRTEDQLSDAYKILNVVIRDAKTDKEHFEKLQKQIGITLVQRRDSKKSQAQLQTQEEII